MTFKHLIPLGGLVLALAGGPAAAVQDGQLAPPEVRMVHPLGVNMQSRQPVVSQQTVSIGGERGLAHSISLHTSHFTLTGGWYGYVDKYAGSARYTLLGEYPAVVFGGEHCPESPGAQVWAMRVFGPAGSEDFKVKINGTVDCNIPRDDPPTSGYSYEAVGDARHTLERIGNGDPDYGEFPDGLRWTTADGTELYYQRDFGSNQPETAISEGRLRKIVHPNGFTLHTSLGGVVTNTGYQLRYEYDTANEKPLSSAKQALFDQLTADLEAYAPGQTLLVQSEGGFSGANPRYIRAINRAVTYCPAGYAGEPVCEDPDNDWPTATFTWPGGMPRAIYLGNSVFKVEDADGGVTEYHYEAQDVMRIEGYPTSSKYAGNIEDVDYPTEQGVFFPYYPKQMWSPRLVGIKSATSEVIDREFEYLNQYILNVTGGDAFWELVNPAKPVGRVRRVSGPEGEAGFGTRDRQGPDAYFGTWRSGDFVFEPGALAGTIARAEVPGQGEYRFENSLRNAVNEFYPLNSPGPKKRYEYDARGNLIKVISQRNESDETVREARYPASCANPKTCNRPEWVKDAKGNRTDYTYHPQSGQVATVTGPPDAGGVRPQTRYTYAQKYAYYKKDGDSVKKADAPVWLPVRESYCRTSAAAGEGCAAGPLDEVVTEYDYGPDDGRANNLHLRRVSVTAANAEGELETRTTCYAYDRYGNRTAQTRPKAGGCWE